MPWAIMRRGARNHANSLDSTAVRAREVAPHRVYVNADVTLQEQDCEDVDQSNPQCQSL